MEISCFLKENQSFNLQNEYEGKLIYKQYPSLFYGTCNTLVKYVNTTQVEKHRNLKEE